MPTLESLVSQLRLAAARARGLRYLVRAAVAAAGGPAAVLLLSRLVPIEPLQPLALAGIPASVLAAAALWIVRRPGGLTLTLAADRALDLKERLSTAWERRMQGRPVDPPPRPDGRTP